MAVTGGTRWNTRRLEAKLTRALREASDGSFARDVERNVSEVIDAQNETIRRSGRGGSHNADFANQQVRVTQSAAGRLNVQAGWLSYPAHAQERGGSGNLWYQYQDEGFRLFGRSDYYIPGVGATVNRRIDVTRAVEDAMESYVDDVARVMRR